MTRAITLLTRNNVQAQDVASGIGVDVIGTDRYKLIKVNVAVDGQDQNALLLHIVQQSATV